MKRDMELIRTILLRAEASETAQIPDTSLDGYDDDVVAYHNYLIADAGLAEGRDCSTRAKPGPYWKLRHLTSAGHDFIDASREQTRWNTAKKKLGDATLAAYTAVLAAMAKKAALDALGLIE